MITNESTYHSKQGRRNWRISLHQILQEERHETQHDNNEIKIVPTNRKVVLTQSKHLEQHLCGKYDDKKDVEILQSKCPSIRHVVMFTAHCCLQINIFVLWNMIDFKVYYFSLEDINIIQNMFRIYHVQSNEGHD